MIFVDRLPTTGALEYFQVTSNDETIIPNRTIMISKNTPPLVENGLHYHTLSWKLEEGELDDKKTLELIVKEIEKF